MHGKKKRKKKMASNSSVPTALKEPRPKVKRSPGKQKAPPTANTVLNRREY